MTLAEVPAPGVGCKQPNLPVSYLLEPPPQRTPRDAKEPGGLDPYLEGLRKAGPCRSERPRSGGAAPAAWRAKNVVNET